MIYFSWPWILPLPLLVRRLPPLASCKATCALPVPFFHTIEQLAFRQGERHRTRSRHWLAALAWALLLTATAQPQWIGRFQDQPTTGRDLMLLVDISSSMRAMDFQLDREPVSRLEMVKRLAGRFIEERQGDRLGLMPPQGSNASAGPAVASHLLQQAGAERGDLLLMTDGVDDQARSRVKELGRAGYRVHVLAVGTLEGGRIPDPDSGYLEIAGKPLQVRLDEQTLAAVARAGNGTYQRFTDGTDGLKRLLVELEHPGWSGKNAASNTPSPPLSIPEPAPGKKPPRPQLQPPIPSAGRPLLRTQTRPGVGNRQSGPSAAAAGDDGGQSRPKSDHNDEKPAGAADSTSAKQKKPVRENHDCACAPSKPGA